MAFLELCELNSSTDELKISFIHKMRHYNCEIATLLSVTEPGTDVIQLFFYCCTLVKKVHEDNIDAVAAAPLENTYNPPRFGRATISQSMVSSCEKYEVSQWTLKIGKILTTRQMKSVKNDFHKLAKRVLRISFCGFAQNMDIALVRAKIRQHHCMLIANIPRKLFCTTSLAVCLSMCTTGSLATSKTQDSFMTCFTATRIVAHQHSVTMDYLDLKPLTLLSVNNLTRLCRRLRHLRN